MQTEVEPKRRSYSGRAVFMYGNNFDSGMGVFRIGLHKRSLDLSVSLYFKEIE